MSNEAKVEKKKLNLFDIFCLGYGGAIGSGIFVLTGIGIAFTGRSIVLVVLVGSLFMMLAYFFNILLSSMFKFRGGDYSQKAVCFNPFFTGFAAYLTIINGFGLAMFSVAVIDYASVIFPGLIQLKTLWSILLTTVIFSTSLRGTKFVAVLNNIMIVIMLAVIALFIFLGFTRVQPGYFRPEGFFTGGVKGFFAAIAIMGWACQGTTFAPVAVGAVTKNARRTIPFGILIGTVALGITYALMVYVAAGVLPLEQVAGQKLSVVAQAIFPYWVFVIFIMGGAVFAIATSMVGGVAMVRYPILKIAEDGWLPKVFTRTTSTGYPWVGYILYYLVSTIPVLLGFSLSALVSFAMIPFMIMNIYLNLACIGIVKKYPEQWKKSILHMPSPFIKIVCVLAAICSGIVCYNLFKELEPRAMVFMLGVLTVIGVASLVVLKTGAVKKEELEANKKAILEEAFKEEED